MNTYRGVANNCDIIFCAIDLNGVTGNSFSTCVADAANYCFAKAAAMGKPCVLNASLGEYGGSHDGTDLATQIIEGLLTAQNGRAMVAACGNGGGAYFHLGYTIPTTDSAYTWFKSFNYAGQSIIYYELYSDYANWNSAQFAFGADKVVGGFSHRKRTPYFSVLTDYQMSTQNSYTRYDTVRNASNQRLGIVESYCEKQGGKYFMYVFVTLDSTNYNWSFITKGTGKFDVWSDLNHVGSSNMVYSGLPTAAQLSDIVKYAKPDTEQTIVSGWNCSPKVISVGNYLNRGSYLNMNNTITNCDNHTVGKIYYTSSKGPTRTGAQKPDISASGEWTLAANDLYWINWAKINAPQNVSKDSLHGPLRGTSAASPAVAGIVALYLQKYPTANWSDIKTSMTTCVKTDAFTGTLPNYLYGYGKIDAFKMLNCKGCTVAGSANYNPNSQINDGSCLPPIGNAPSNDNLCSSMQAGGGYNLGLNNFNNSNDPNFLIINGNTGTATAEAFEPVPSCASIGGVNAKSVWYKFQAPLCGNMTVNISTNQATTNFNTVIAVYSVTGPCSSPTFTEIACNDDVSATNLTSSISLTSSQYIAGASYYIQLAGKSGVSGMFRLKIDVDAPNPTIGTVTYGSVDLSLPSVGNQYNTRIRYTELGVNGYGDVQVNNLSTSTINNLLSGATYNFWSLYQCNPTGVEKYFSTPVNATTLTGCNSTNITNGPSVTPVGTSCRLVNVTWPILPPALNPYGYRLYWRVVGSSSYYGATLSTNSYTTPPSMQLAPNTSYQFWYKVICAGNATAVSPITIYNTCASSKPGATNQTPDSEVYEQDGAYSVGMPINHIPFVEPDIKMGQTFTVKFNSLTKLQYEQQIEKENLSNIPNMISPIQPEIELIPNPASSSTHLYLHLPGNISHANGTLTIFDMKGAEMEKKSITIKESFLETEIFTSRLESGIYLVKVVTPDYVGVKKLVVSHQ